MFMGRCVQVAKKDISIWKRQTKMVVTNVGALVFPVNAAVQGIIDTRSVRTKRFK